jgi:hypothetical protein
VLLLRSIDYVIRFVYLDTAFIASRGGWLYCDDSRVTQANPKEVVVSAFAPFVLVSFLADCIV